MKTKISNKDMLALAQRRKSSCAGVHKDKRKQKDNLGRKGKHKGKGWE